MRAEHLVPLSARAADAVRAQQAELPQGTPWLFPSPSDPHLPVAYSTLRGVFNAWQERIGLHDEAGRPLHVTSHQLRHTFGTQFQLRGSAARDPAPAVSRQPRDDQLLRPPARHHHPHRIRTLLPDRVDIEGRLLGFDPGGIATALEVRMLARRFSDSARQSLNLATLVAVIAAGCVRQCLS